MLVGQDNRKLQNRRLLSIVCCFVSFAVKIVLVFCVSLNRKTDNNRDSKDGVLEKNKFNERLREFISIVCRLLELHEINF